MLRMKFPQGRVVSVSAGHTRGVGGFLTCRSLSNTLVSVRRVTEVNAGRKTAGIDGQVVLTAPGKSELARFIQQRGSIWQARPVRRVFIPKAVGRRRRPLGIPVIVDRVPPGPGVGGAGTRVRGLVRGEVVWLPPGRGCHDAIGVIYNTLNGKNAQRVWILDADLAAAFDRIDHDRLLAQLGTFPARGMVRQWLKAGVVERGRFTATRRGGGRQLGHRSGGVGGLSSALAGLAFLAQDPVHRGDRAVVAPGIQLTGPDLGGRQLGVLVAVHQLQYCGPLFGCQSRGLDLRFPGGSLWWGPQPAVVGDPRAAGQPARGGDAQRVLDAGEGIVGDRGGGMRQSAPSEIISKSAEAFRMTSNAALFRASSFSRRSAWRRSFSFSASAGDFFGLAGLVRLSTSFSRAPASRAARHSFTCE
ncbi:reverse transcriptase N-terminal domain-containing protein [Streptomyces sp. NPDC002144]